MVFRHITPMNPCNEPIQWTHTMNLYNELMGWASLDKNSVGKVSMSLLIKQFICDAVLEEASNWRMTCTVQTKEPDNTWWNIKIALNKRFSSHNNGPRYAMFKKLKLSEANVPESLIRNLFVKETTSFYNFTVVNCNEYFAIHEFVN